MADLDVGNVDAANALMEQRNIYVAQKAALATLTTENFTFQFDQEATNFDVGVAPWSYQFLSGATPGSADADAFDALNTIISDYLDAKIAEVDAALVAIGVTP